MKKRVAMMSAVGPWIGKPRGWERVVRRIVPPAKLAGLPERVVRREGSLFIADPAVPIGWHVLFFGGYEFELRAVMRQVLRPGCVAVDAGSNVGWHTLLMARLVGATGRVLAVEANPSVRSRLAEHVALNHLTNVEIVPLALGSGPGTVGFQAPDFRNPGAGDGHVVTGDERQGADTIRVEVTSLDALCAERALSRLDFLKIDVEGFEWPILQGGRDCLRRFRPVVSFEFASGCLQRGQGSEQKFRSHFTEAGYRFFLPTRGGLRPLEGKAWPSHANLVALPR